MSSSVKLIKYKLPPSSLANWVVKNFSLRGNTLLFFEREVRILVQEMILTQNTQETYTMCWRQVRIYIVLHILSEVRSQLYKLQIPVREKGELVSLYIIALKPLETLACCLGPIHLQFESKVGHIR